MHDVCFLFTTVMTMRYTRCLYVGSPFTFLSSLFISVCSLARFAHLSIAMLSRYVKLFLAGHLTTHSNNTDLLQCVGRGSNCVSTAVQPGKATA